MIFQRTKLSSTAFGLALFIAGAGIANATDVIDGQGTFSVNGSIKGATCTAAFDKTAFAFPTQDLAAIAASSPGSILLTDTASLVFNNCSAGDVDIVIQRDVEPPAGSSGNALTKGGGFKYSGGVNTDSTTGPLVYKVLLNNVVQNTNGTANTPTKVPADGIVPVLLRVERSATSAAAVTGYDGSYAGSFTYSVSYP
ncbi:hypothetical protein PJP40_004643 [Salmonella enterica]|nr:hypothetical protein [Salmonella enterica]